MYEDFLEGLTAKATRDGDVHYEVESGIFKSVCRDARTDYRETEEGDEPPKHVLIIHEINRGDLPQIFGETITLLEADKRGTVSTDLTLSSGGYTVPRADFVELESSRSVECTITFQRRTLVDEFCEAVAAAVPQPAPGRVKLHQVTRVKYFEEHTDGGGLAIPFAEQSGQTFPES